MLPENVSRRLLQEAGGAVGHSLSLKMKKLKLALGGAA
jgi:hypothetical protein